MDNFLTMFNATAELDALTETYGNLTYGLPKTKLFVKLSEDITDDRKNYIANGIRGFFRDDTTLLLDLRITLVSIANSIFLF